MEVWGEDEVALAIIKAVAEELGLREYLRPRKFGAASNAYTVAGARVLEEASNAYTIAGTRALEGVGENSCIIVLDGDALVQKADQEEAANKAVTGNGPWAEGLRAKLLTYICKFLPPRVNMNPEAFLLECSKRGIGACPDVWLASYLERAAAYHHANAKGVMRSICERFSRGEDEIIGRFLDCAMKDPAWVDYTAEVRARLKAAARHHNLPTTDDLVAPPAETAAVEVEAES